MPETRIAEVGRNDSEGIAAVRMLLSEYADWLAPFMKSTTIAEEIESLPAPFVRPAGCLVVAREANGQLCGCVGLKVHESTVCEVKRLFVRPACRGSGVGRALLVAVLDAACDIGYQEALVSTVPSHMPEASRMYQHLGFEEIERFENHTHSDVGIRYLRLDLRLWCEQPRRQG